MRQRRRPARMLVPTQLRFSLVARNTWMTKDLIVGPGKASTYILRIVKLEAIGQTFKFTKGKYYVGA